MDLTNVTTYYGFRKPYNFPVVIPVLLGTLELLLVFITCAFLVANGHLSVGTERFYFFSFVTIMLCIAVVFSKVTLLSTVVLFWCTLELSLATSSSLLEIGIPLLPGDHFPPMDKISENERYLFHPLLQRVPKPNWRGHTQHLLDIRNKDRGDFENWPINWAQVEDQKFTFSHNSLGMRGRELTAEDFKRDMIFAYGGSTTYDVSVTQGSTWVERLEAELKNKYTVVNFGMETHSTTEHLIETAFYQSTIKKVPICAIYYVGWNDIANAHIKNLDQAYIEFHAPAVALRRPEFSIAKYSPFVRLVSYAARERFDTIPDLPLGLFEQTPESGSDARLEAIFAEHIRTIAAIDISRDITPIFIGQILNRELFRLNPEERNAVAPLVRNKDMWRLQERFNVVLKNEAIASGGRYIDAGIENFNPNDFSDEGHFVASGSDKFAKQISGEVSDYCHRPESSSAAKNSTRELK